MLKQLGSIPGALMIVPLFLDAVAASFASAILNIGSFIPALFNTGTPVLIGPFFVCVGSSIGAKAAVPAIEKGIVLLLAKVCVAVVFGRGVAFLMPERFGASCRWRSLLPCQRARSSLP